mmetsp:Transcript_27782/g.70161  ORF Transcript_27782/g.70161 Transcript_27782/m.70161 type:complete len:284 (-) Transcript_27782:403-1254(-)
MSTGALKRLFRIIRLPESIAVILANARLALGPAPCHPRSSIKLPARHVHFQRNVANRAFPAGRWHVLAEHFIVRECGRALRSSLVRRKSPAMIRCDQGVAGGGRFSGDVPRRGTWAQHDPTSGTPGSVRGRLLQVLLVVQVNPVGHDAAGRRFRRSDGILRRRAARGTRSRAVRRIARKRRGRGVNSTIPSWCRLRRLLRAGSRFDVEDLFCSRRAEVRRTGETEIQFQTLRNRTFVTGLVRPGHARLAVFCGVHAATAAQVLLALVAQHGWLVGHLRAWSVR